MVKAEFDTPVHLAVPSAMSLPMHPAHQQKARPTSPMVGQSSPMTSFPQVQYSPPSSSAFRSDHPGINWIPNTPPPIASPGGARNAGMSQPLPPARLPFPLQQSILESSGSTKVSIVCHEGMTMDSMRKVKQAMIEAIGASSCHVEEVMMPGRTESFETIHKGVPVVKESAVNINISRVKVPMWARNTWDDFGFDPDRTLHGRINGILQEDQAYTNQVVTQVIDVHPDVQGRLRMHPEEMSGAIRGGSAWLDSEDPLEKFQRLEDEASISDFTSEDSTMSGWGAESKARERSQRRSEKKKDARNKNKKKAAPKPKAKAKNAQAKAKAKQRAMQLAIEQMPCVGVGGI